MCKQCRDEHTKSPETKHHKLVHYRHRKRKLPVEKCKNHPTKNLDMLCEDCEIPVCSKCATQYHQKHAFKDLEEIYSKRFILCLEEINKINQNFLPTSKHMKKNVEEDKISIKEYMRNIRKHVKDESKYFLDLMESMTL